VVHFDVLDDVLVGGEVAIGRGAVAVGKVTDARGKKMMGRGGHVQFDARFVTAADGSQLGVSGVRRVKGANSAKTVTTGIVVSAVLFLPAALLFHSLYDRRRVRCGQGPTSDPGVRTMARQTTRLALRLVS
jgi:hypothetical protein